MNMGMNGMMGTVDSRPIRPATPSPLEHHHDDTEGSADAQQVEQSRLEGHENRPEHEGQEQHGHQNHRADKQPGPGINGPLVIAVDISRDSSVVEPQTSGSS